VQECFTARQPIMIGGNQGAKSRLILLGRRFILTCLQFLDGRLVVQRRNHAAQRGFEVLKVDDVTADTSKKFVESDLRVVTGLHGGFVYWSLIRSHRSLPSTAPISGTAAVMRHSQNTNFVS